MAQTAKIDRKLYVGNLPPGNMSLFRNDWTRMPAALWQLFAV